MSSASSATTNSREVQTKKQKIQTQNILENSSEESENQQVVEGSNSALKNMKGISQKIVEMPGPPTNKSSATVDMYHNDSHKHTGSTRNSTTPTVITAVLRDLRDDIVHSSSYQQSGHLSLMNGDRAIAVIGGDNVYVQNKSRFISLSRDKALSNQEDQFRAYQTNKLEQYSILDVAVRLQKMFTPLSSICFGLLGGVALLQVTLVYHLLKGVSDENLSIFLESYSRFAELIPLLFYILLAFCIVSGLDRAQLQQSHITSRQSWLVVTVHVVTLVITLSCTSYDNMFVLYPQNKMLFQDQMKVTQFVSEWQLLNTLRCFFAILGWVLFTLTSPPDLFHEQLIKIKEYEHWKQPSPTHSRNIPH